MNTKNDQVIKKETVTIDTLVFEGKGMGMLTDGRKAFVYKVLPQEKVEFLVQSNRHSFVEGWATNIIEPSPDRIVPACPHFEQCAGCSFQNMPYVKQLFWKDHFLTESLVRLGGFDAERVKKWQKPIIGAQNTLHYRNKTEFSFTDNEGHLKVGFHNPLKRFHMIDQDRCLLQSETAQKAFELIQKIVQASKLDVFDLYRNKNGFLFSITFRTSYRDEILIALNTHDLPFPEDEKKLWVETFVAGLGQKLVGIVQVQKDRKETASEPKVVQLWGSDTLEDRVEDLSFEIGAQSFFQVNREMASVMVRKIRDYIQSKKHSVHVLDLFCGNGFLGMSVAKGSQTVTGIELNASAVVEGRKNLKKNNITNYTFYQGDTRKILTQLLEQGQKFDTVIVDPPRGGLGRKTVKTIAKIQSDEIVYISCNPATLARDLEVFEICGYEVVSVQAMDLFPQTYHLETFCILRKVKDYAIAKNEWIASGKEWR